MNNIRTEDKLLEQIHKEDKETIQGEKIRTAQNLTVLPNKVTEYANLIQLAYKEEITKHVQGTALVNLTNKEVRDQI